MSGFALRRLASPVTANVLGGFSVVLVAAGIALDVLGHEGNLAQSIGNLLVYVMLGAAGLVVARAQPRNPVGWLLLAAALGLALAAAAGEYEVLIYRQGHAALPFGPAAVLLNLLWSPGIVTFGLIVLLFPDGRLTRGWRRVMWTYLAVGACWPAGIYAVAVSTVAGHRIRVDSGGGLTIIDSPSGTAAWLGTAQDVILPLLVVFWVVILARQVTRYRRASGDERAQLKWLVWGAIVFALGGMVITLGGALDPNPSAVVQVAEGVALVALNAFPLSVGVAILKYRLYEIDRVISRTLAYAIVTGLLVGCYIGVVALATDVLAFGGTVGVAVSTLAVAALFNPVRRRVQRIVDRRFNRARYDADQTVSAFAARLQDAVDPAAVQDDLLSAVQRSLEPAHASLWLSRE
jgi:uncharacterized membrane protein